MPTSSVTGSVTRRVHARARGVERELADRDAHAVGAEIAQAEDALAVGHDDGAHVGVGPVAQDVAARGRDRPR